MTGGGDCGVHIWRSLTCMRVQKEGEQRAGLGGAGRLERYVLPAVLKVKKERKKENNPVMSPRKTYASTAPSISRICMYNQSACQNPLLLHVPYIAHPLRYDMPSTPVGMQCHKAASAAALLASCPPHGCEPQRSALSCSCFCSSPSLLAGKLAPNALFCRSKCILSCADILFPACNLVTTLAVLPPGDAGPPPPRNVASSTKPPMLSLEYFCGVTTVLIPVAVAGRPPTTATLSSADAERA